MMIWLSNSRQAFRAWPPSMWYDALWYRQTNISVKFERNAFAYV